MLAGLAQEFLGQAPVVLVLSAIFQRLRWRYRERAYRYALIETGLRRAAIRNLDLVDVDLKSRTVTAQEKGGHRHTCKITQEGLAAIMDYAERERSLDSGKWNSAALFLAPATTPHGDGRLNTRVINTIWTEVCRLAGVEGRTPHSARHAMGKHIIEKTGNIAAVQRQLGHKNAAYSMQYARITDEELLKVIEDR
jgi:integrase